MAVVIEMSPIAWLYSISSRRWSTDRPNEILVHADAGGFQPAQPEAAAHPLALAQLVAPVAGVRACVRVCGMVDHVGEAGGRAGRALGHVMLRRVSERSAGLQLKRGVVAERDAGDARAAQAQHEPGDRLLPFADGERDPARGEAVRREAAVDVAVVGHDRREAEVGAGQGPGLPAEPMSWRTSSRASSAASGSPS